RLLEANRVTLRALIDHTVEDHAADRGGGIGLDRDAAALRLRCRVLAGDAELLEIRPGLDLNRIARLGCVHGGLEGLVARRVPAAGRIGPAHVTDGGGLSSTGPGSAGDDEDRGDNQRLEV